MSDVLSRQLADSYEQSTLLKNQLKQIAKNRKRLREQGYRAKKPKMHTPRKKQAISAEHAIIQLKRRRAYQTAYYARMRAKKKVQKCVVQNSWFIFNQLNKHVCKHVLRRKNVYACTRMYVFLSGSVGSASQRKLLGKMHKHTTPVPTHEPPLCVKRLPIPNGKTIGI